jgi:hypothetical protein
MTKYFADKNKFERDNDTPISVRDYTQIESRNERYCPYCQLKLSRLIDNSGLNPSWYCGKCVIEYPDKSETKSKSHLSTQKPSSERPAVSYAPEPQLPKRDHTIKGSFLELQKRGFKIKNYTESKG